MARNEFAPRRSPRLHANERRRMTLAPRGTFAPAQSHCRGRFCGPTAARCSRVRRGGTRRAARPTTELRVRRASPSRSCRFYRSRVRSGSQPDTQDSVNVSEDGVVPFLPLLVQEAMDANCSGSSGIGWSRGKSTGSPGTRRPRWSAVPGYSVRTLATSGRVSGVVPRSTRRTAAAANELPRGRALSFARPLIDSTCARRVAV